MNHASPERGFEPRCLVPIKCKTSTFTQTALTVPVVSILPTQFARDLRDSPASAKTAAFSADTLIDGCAEFAASHSELEA